MTPMCSFVLRMLGKMGKIINSLTIKGIYLFGVGSKKGGPEDLIDFRPISLVEVCING